MNRHRLFGKILLAFLLTYLAITQGVWLVFALNDRRDVPEFLMAREIGPTALEAAAQAIARGGAPAFAASRAQISSTQRDRLSVLPLSAAAQPANALAPGLAALTRQATGPDGQVWLIRFTYHTARFPIRSLNTPPEVLALGLVAGLIFSAALAWYLLTPINHLRRAFEQLAQGALSTRLSPRIGRRRDEIADLGHDFDRMAQRLEHLVADRDRLLHDVSHELRSPLARMQMAIGLARQSPERSGPAMDRMENEIARLDMLVGELLTLARAEHAHAAAEDYFDIAGVCARVADDARYEAQAHDVAIALTGLDAGPDWPPVRGNSELARRAIENVVRNALRFSPRGGRIAMAITFTPASGLFRIGVGDQGPGVPDAMIETMFEPFVRGNPAAGTGATGPGPGLGLAIASRAIVAHGGRITAANRPGGGLDITIEIPAAKA